LNLARRAFTAGALLAPALARASSPDGVSAILAAVEAWPPGPVLLNSYITTGTSDFDTTQANAAYVYDNALAGMALFHAGHTEAAGRIASALAVAQAHDRFYHDGRLRNAYMAGAMAQPAKLPGWWDGQAGQWREDPYQAGSQTGPVAWAMLLWAAVGMPEPAKRAGAWLNSALRAASGYYGGFYGFEPDPLKLTWQSTEQNTDCYAAFAKLGDASSAAHAGAFVKSMQHRLFDAGLAPDGTTNALLAADAGIWPYLAGLGSAAPALAAIKGLQHGKGIGFSAASTGIWPEGTAFAMLALKQMNNPLAANFATTLAANVSPSGYVYATVDATLSTGLTVGPSLQPGVAPKAFNYFRRPSLSATAWTALAMHGVNPLI
jgi:hypothetical protein